MDTSSTAVDDVYTPTRAIVGCSCFRLLPCAKDQISQGPALSIHQYPETTASTEEMDTTQGAAVGGDEPTPAEYQSLTGSYL